MSSRFSKPSLVSIYTAVIAFSFHYDVYPRSPSSKDDLYGKYIDLLPLCLDGSGYKQLYTPVSASFLLLTYGNNIPSQPASSAC